MSRRKVNESGPRAAGSSASPGRFSCEGLDRVMHEKARLGILSSLAAHAGGLLFNDLKKLCSLTDGNLNCHLAVLSDAGLVEVWKNTKGGRQHSMYRLTSGGRRRFAEYINVLESLVSDAQADLQSKPARAASWSPA